MSNYLDISNGMIQRKTAAIGCRVYHSANQAISNSIATALAFDSEDFDTNNCHDSVTNNSRLVAQTAGYYAIGASIYWSSTRTYGRATFIRVNGTTTIARSDTSSPGGVTLSTSYYLNANDYVECVVFQSSGSSATINANSGTLATNFWIYRLF